MAIEKFDDLTKTQQGLISELVKEFTKINPKPTKGDKRFTLDTINECLKEEQRFNDTMTKHNLTMIKLFVTQLKADIKEFEKEFGKVIKIHLGYNYPTSENQHHTLESFIDANTKHSLSCCKSREVILHFVSKQIKYNQGDSRNNYFGYNYYAVYVDFKRESVKIVLENGKQVGLTKIIGLEYNTYNWLHRNNVNNVTFSSLDELIQRHQPTQQNLAKLV